MIGRLSTPLSAIPDGMVQSATNVDIRPRGVCWPRVGLSKASVSGSPPAVGVRYLFSDTYTSGAETLWAWASDNSATPTLSTFNGTTWSSVTLSDTVVSSNSPHAVSFNGKRFWAYNSNVNRLHVYDATGTMRRVGIVATAAPTVANTGAGAYAATLRYYKVQFRIYDSAPSIVASSELSPSVSFTPSGAGTAARVTKPTTPDSATHWVVYGSTDNITFYDLSGAIAVATTTYDDSTTPSAYSGGAVAPEAGLFVPPPSAKFLVSDGTRLLMAGSWETTASSGETTPSDRRVWFTRPMGATDQGDDESITSTTGNRYWIDINDPRASAITALQVIGGLVYVFFPESLWRLVPTGIDGTPYRAEQVSSSVGAESQYATCVGAMGSDDAIYFVSTRSGLYRVSTTSGLEWLGRDVIGRSPTISGFRLAYDQNARDLWVISTIGGGNCAQVAVDYLTIIDGEYHGGARTFYTGNSSVSIECAVPYAGSMYLGGGGSYSASLYYLTSSATSDDGTAITSTVVGPTWADGLSRYLAEEPTLSVGQTLSSATVTVTLADPYSNVSRSDTETFSLTNFGLVSIEGLGLSDAKGVRATVSVTASGYSLGNHVDTVRVPYVVREPL